MGYQWRLFSKVIAVPTVVLISSLAIAGLSARFFFKQQFIEQTRIQLRDILTGLSKDLPDKLTKVESSWCQKHATGISFRLTLIMTNDGTVFCDSHEDPDKMENHANRDEFIKAKKSGFGTSLRLSNTLHESLMYGALISTNGKTVIRAAIPVSVLAKSLKTFDLSLGLITVIISFIAALFTFWTGEKLVIPLNRLLVKTRAPISEADPDPTGAEGFNELTELESSIDHIRRDLAVTNEKLENEREELATIMRSISDAILATDRDGVPLFYNSKYAILFGNKERLWELFRVPELLNAFQNATTKNKSAEVKTLELETKEGKRHFALAVSPLHKRNGDCYGAVAVFHDISELKQAEQIRIEFVANVSHELRTPLTAIKGYADTLLQCVDQSRPISRDFLDIIIKNSTRLTNLINDLLDLSSVESNVLNHYETISTRDITERVIQQLKNKNTEKGQKITITINAAIVYGDPERIEQVLVNLLDNAIKYTQQNGEIAVLWEHTQNNEVTLQVKDNGPGIAEEHLLRLFERFYRVDKARSREQGGTGLGLAIAKHIMQKHGGNIAVKSAPGKGTTFICQFPKKTV